MYELTESIAPVKTILSIPKSLYEEEEGKIVGDFIQYIKELIDFDDLIDEPSARIMTGGIGDPMVFPTFLMCIVRKESKDIIKMEFDRGKSNDNQ